MAQQKPSPETSAAPSDVMAHTVEIVSAYVARNSLTPADVIKTLSEVHRALMSIDGPASSPSMKAPPVPAVPIKKSVTADFIICLEDGKKFKSMKRHLSTLGMTPDAYRAKWGLRSDYPMVAANYSNTRSGLAKKLGLGRKPRATTKKPKRKAKAK
jgi:predicted transcriptional regulator